MFDSNKPLSEETTGLLKAIAHDYFAAGGKPVTEEQLKLDIKAAHQEAYQARMTEWLKEQEIKYGPLSQEAIDYAEKAWNSRRKRAD